MTNLLKKPVTFEKVEFWAATAIYCLFVFVLLGQMINADANDSPLRALTEPFGGSYNNSDGFLPSLAEYTTFYVWFVVIDLFVMRWLINGKYIPLNILLLGVICIVCAVSLAVTQTWTKSYLYDSMSNEWEVHRLLFSQSFVFLVWLLILLGFYTFLKQIIRANSSFLQVEKLGGRQLFTECATAFAIWILLAFFFRMSDLHWTTALAWCAVLFYGICLYWYLSFKIVPQIAAKKLQPRDFLLKVFTIELVSVPVVSVLLFLLFRRLNTVFYLGIFNGALGLFVVAPLTWFLYQYRNRRYREVLGLKTELGQSSANLDFLRSQINPHFLFNALNTLYGTALQENAERTGGGIQKLGDMMRFMLQENIQEKISLTREVDYLNNYIELQQLRTQTSPDILIQTEIDEEIKGLEIAPMLLIPFVENAFKHGISLREPSHIKISLQTRHRVLFFDVSNSIHPKGLNDPEKDKSGIGLENVRQRLNLLYPNQHELTVRESAKEFFIHLTVTLAG